MLDLYKKDKKDRKLAQELLNDPMFLDEFINSIYKQKCSLRYKDFKALHLISINNPEVLYQYWDNFINFFYSGNDTLIFYAIHLFVNLVNVDVDKKFLKLYKDFFNLLKGPVIPACHVALTAWKIVLVYPDLEPEITVKLLNTLNSLHRHREIICASAIESFSNYFEKTDSKESIRKFVDNLKDNKSPKARKASRDFILKYET